MLPLFRSLLYLYPSLYRAEYGDEMLGVLSEVNEEIRKKQLMMRFLPGVHEAAGLLFGALREHLRTMTGSYRSAMFSPRRSMMHSEFRFPKATVALMTIILIAVIMVIEKAKAISISLPQTSQNVGPIQPEQFTTVTTFFVVLASACAVGVIGWAILFALRRSGMHRLSDIQPSAGQRSGNRLSA
jgi:hypothetical protein